MSLQAPRGARPVMGVAWPVTNEKTGERGSTKTNKVIHLFPVKNRNREMAHHHCNTCCHFFPFPIELFSPLSFQDIWTTSLKSVPELASKVQKVLEVLFTV